MKRTVESALEAWSRKPSRKPLVVRGARQVGKSWLIRTWGKARYGTVVELNLERDPKLQRAFIEKDPRQVVRRLEAQTGRIIRPDATNLLFLDEIQAAPHLLASLRWFAEELPRLPVVAAGSLLDFALAEHTFSMPVGRISYLHLEPLGFEEFLAALGEDVHLRLVSEEPWSSPLLASAHDKLLAHFRSYLFVGGMPAVVERWVETGSAVEVRQAQAALLESLRDDFAKYANRVHHQRLASVMASVPAQLGSSFSYARVDRGQRAAAISAAVEMLELARVVHTVRATKATGVPVAAGAEKKHFKLLMLDSGLAHASLSTPAAVLEHDDLLLANAGGSAEQAVGQLLRLGTASHLKPELFYWRRGEPGSEAEVDYVVDHGRAPLPIEVKAGAGGTLKSLHVLMAKRRWKLAVRFNADVPSLTPIDVRTPTGERARYELMSLPLYLAGQLPRLLASAVGSTPGPEGFPTP